MEKLEILKLPFPEPGPPITKMTGLSIVISDDRFGQKLELFLLLKQAEVSGIFRQTVFHEINLTQDSAGV